MNAQRIKLNLIPGGIPPIVHVSQYDVGRTLEFALYDGVTAATVESGTAIDIRGTKPDKTGFSYPCTYSGNVVAVNTAVQMTAVAGSFDCELRLVKDTNEIGTANFILEVEPAALTDETIISESELPVIVEAARNNGLTEESVQKLVNSASAAANSATAAANSATAAAASETNAADSASAANTSKTAAANSASSAAQSADEASTYNRMAYEYSTNAERAAESAARSAQQALENATGTSVFNGSDAGLVPSTDLSNGFLDADGQWKEKSWMNKNSFVNRVIDGNTTPRALSKGDLFMRPNKSNGEWRLCRASKAIAANTELSLGNYDEISFQTLLDEMKTSFQDGVDAIYGAITAKNVIPSASTPTALATAVGTVYDKGRSLGHSEGYNEGKSAAEAVTWVGQELEFSLYNNQYSVGFDARTVKSFRWNASNSDAKVRCYKTNGSYSTIDFVAYGSTNEHTLGNDVVRLWINCQSGYCHCKIQFTYQMKLKN